MTFLFSVLIFSLASYPLMIPNSEGNILVQESQFSMIHTAFAQSDGEDKFDDEEDVENEAEIEIKVKIEDGIVKIKVEFGDGELDFEIEWIDEQTTIDEIALRTGLSLDEIEGAITFEIKDEIEENGEVYEIDEEGIITEILSDSSFTFETEDDTFTIIIDDNTEFNHIDGFDNLETGLRVEVEAVLTDTDELLATEIDLDEHTAEDIAEKSERLASKIVEREARLIDKAQFAEERAAKIIQKLEQKIQKMDERLQKLMDRVESGKYFGNLKNVDTITKSFTVSFDGIASQIGNSSNEITFDGKLFLENQVTGNHIKKFRVSGGEIFVGESDVYDIIFGKARLTSSGSGGEKNSMVVIGQVSNGVDVRTLKLILNLSESFDSPTESVDIEILSPRSEIANKWLLSGTGNLGLTESDETIPQEDSADKTGDTAKQDVEIPDVDIPITTAISVSTSESSYLTGDTVMISGIVDEIFDDTPVIMQLISPVDLIEIAQIDVKSDGVYTHTIIAQGSQWISDGTYTVKVFYGANNIAETSFELMVEN